MHDKNVTIDGTCYYYAGKIEGKEVFRDSAELSTKDFPWRWFPLTNGKMVESKHVRMVKLSPRVRSLAGAGASHGSHGRLPVGVSLLSTS
jgi:hypothetical protein